MKKHWKSQSDEDRRNRILSAAQEIFSLHGFRDAEVKQIAERAGVGKATIYKFFESKEALLLVVVEENLARMRDLTLSSLVGSSGDPLDRLENATRAMANFISANKEL
ncbi:MAG TPA: TetR/AcrR family transcriptional regulator, partial [Pseudomonadales bacterium]|nr:TetR/AcrR family transcriptional regulator [Pseudomonadales bacterium]